MLLTLMLCGIIILIGPVTYLTSYKIDEWAHADDTF